MSRHSDIDWFLRERPQLGVPIALAAYCGLREAEVLGLQWEDIDWERRTAEIRRTQRRGVFSKPQSKASRRTIELPAPLIAELER
jgi:integrase